MSRTATHADEQGLARDPNAPKPEEILGQVSHILMSPAFLGSKRCQQFLEYVCQKSLAGDAGGLKERAIAMEVFGRAANTGLGEDTIVRVGAREVRKRLAQYYVTAEGTGANILIELPPGSYAPEFRYAAAARHPVASSPPVAQVALVALDPVAVPQTVEPLPRLARRSFPRPAMAAVGAVLAIGLAIAAVRWPASDPRERAFLRFWGPVFQSSGALLIGVGHPIAYQPSRRAALLNAQRNLPTEVPMQDKIDLPASELSALDFIPVMNQYVGFGDLVAANEVTQMMARRSRGVRVMLASSIPFADLRRSPAYLIGSLSNRWTMELSQNWRYRFAWGPDHIAVIKDTQAGSERHWTIPVQDDGSTPEDYSLIARIRNSPTGGLLIVSAGIKQFGTEAAGRLLADPGDLGAILNKLPPGWEDKNLEVVLHNRVIGNTPAQAEVVASWVW